MLNKVKLIIKNLLFKGSHKYWEKRYIMGGNSGGGSYGINSEYKSEVLNTFVKKNNLNLIIEFGCGDGNQLKGFNFPNYIGLDVSETAIKKCIDIFRNDPKKSFFLYNPTSYLDNNKVFVADLSISLDVIYHLIEDNVFHKYMKHLFASSKSYVIIYAWDVDSETKEHVRHRKFTDYISTNFKNWKLVGVNPFIPKIAGACDFFIYQIDT